MKQLKANSRSMREDYGATDVQMKQQIWTVVENRERLEDATKSDVRRMFKDWVNSPEAATEQPNAKQEGEQICANPKHRSVDRDGELLSIPFGSIVVLLFAAVNTIRRAPRVAQALLSWLISKVDRF